MAKNLEEIVLLISTSRKVETKDEKLQGTVEARSSTPCLASSLAALLTGRNESAGTHSPLTVSVARFSLSFQPKWYVKLAQYLLSSAMLVHTRPLREQSKPGSTQVIGFLLKCTPKLANASV